MSVCLSLSVCLSVHMSGHMSVCLSVHMSLSVCPYVCLSVCLSVCPYVCLSVHMSVCLFICLCSVLPRISQRRGGVGVAKWDALVGAVVSNVSVVI